MDNIVVGGNVVVNMYDTIIQRTQDLVALLDHDYSYAATRTALAERMGLTAGQINYLLTPGRHPEAWEAWQLARHRIRADRCAVRRCAMCGITKPAADFPTDRRDGCGIARRCRVCNRLATRLYRQRQT